MEISPPPRIFRPQTKLLPARYNDGTSELIQVCADASDPQTAAREIRALEAARSVHPDAAVRLLTATIGGLPSSIPRGVVAEPAWLWIVRSPS